MKAFGIVLVGVGIALLLFTLTRSLNSPSSFISPVPDTKGVKVILVNPSRSK